MRRSVILGLAIAIGGSRFAAAQHGVDAQVFRPALDADGILGTERARTAERWELGFGFHVSYARNPLHLRLNLGNSGNPTQNTGVIDASATFHFGAHLGITDHLQLAFAIPISSLKLSRTGFGDPNASNKSAQRFAMDLGTNVAPSQVAPGDAHVGLKWCPWQSGSISIGAALIGSLPFGDEYVFLGASSYTVEPRLIFDARGERFSGALNAGYRWHSNKDVVLDPVPMADGAQGVAIADADEIVGSVALLVRASSHVSLVGEVFHSEPVAVSSSAPAGTTGDPLTDVRFGLLIQPMRELGITLAGGMGLQSGARQEDALAIAGVSWAPGRAERYAERSVLEPEDRDDDGVVDREDRCPERPEDRDGHEDDDGCPDLDDDGDGIPDLQDKCPNEPEDRDGYQDDDGCPDPDNDGDGIPDIKDACPNEAEIFNGLDDEDGCPDSGGGERALWRITDRILFALGSVRLDDASSRKLDEVAATLRRHPEIHLVRVEGHADESERSAQETSQRRAERVMRYLIEHGVDPRRLQFVGYGAKRPKSNASTPPERGLNCRVEMIVVE